MIEIKDSRDCCGCTACTSVCPTGAIQMKSDEKGFLYPFIDINKCVQCGKCDRVCPLKERHSSDSTQSSVKKSFALRLKDKETLYNSSSGGAFFAIVNFILNNGGIVFGAVYDKNMIVRHMAASTIEECRKFQGSKYSQSDLTGIYPLVKENLNNNRLVLFSGTPCQNHGLLRYLHKPYDNLVTVDIICHSVPSPLIFKKYIKMIEDKYNDKITNISMRDKTFGWGTIDSYKYYFKSGLEVLNPKWIKCWQLIFESGLITRDSCFDCQYTNLDRVTDYTIGDFWDPKNLRPDIKSKDGTSILLINSEKGLALFEKIKNTIDYWKVTEKEYMQPRLIESTKKPHEYDQFWHIYFKNGFQKAYLCFFSKKNRLYKAALRLLNKFHK